MDRFVFRLWHSTQKNWLLYSDKLIWNEEKEQWLEDGLKEIPITFVGEVLQKYNNDPNIVIQQSTGIRVDGVLVFEGDRVECEIGNKTVVGTVIYKDSKLVLEALDSYWHLNTLKMKIVGNIFDAC